MKAHQGKLKKLNERYLHASKMSVVNSYSKNFRRMRYWMNESCKLAYRMAKLGCKFDQF